MTDENQKPQTTNPAGKSDCLPRLVRHLDAGGQIAASTGQNIYRVKEGEYFLSCETPGCCDEFMDLNGLLALISDEGMEWECLPNVEDTREARQTPKMKE